MELYDVSKYFHKNLIRLYQFCNVYNLDDFIILLIKTTNIKIQVQITHNNILQFIQSNYSHPFFLTLQWLIINEEPIQINKKLLSNLIPNFYKKEESYIIAKLYLRFFNVIKLTYQFKIQFTSFTIDLLLGNNICVEIDENQHNNYNKEYEIDRNILLSLIGYKVIHINPKLFYNNEDHIINIINNIILQFKSQQLITNQNYINYLNFIKYKKNINKDIYLNYKTNSDHIWLY